VAYQDIGNSLKATVKKFNGTGWVDVGTAGFSAGRADYTSIAIDASSTPYVAYRDGGNSSKATVKKFNGTSWVDVGAAGFSAGIANNTSIAIRPDGIPIVVYSSQGAVAKSFSNFILPLKFLEFKGQAINNDGLLNWKTENEQSTSHFEIERNTDGRSYNTVGELVSANAPGIHHYSFTDRNITSLNAPVIYYRLKQIDIDGRFTYSRIIALSIDNTKNIILFYPNPVINEANLTITIHKPDQVQARVVDIAGRVVKQLQWNLSAGSTSLRVEVSRLVKGMYYLELKGRSVNYKKQFVKQ
jgi:hypothetical protein